MVTLRNFRNSTPPKRCDTPPLYLILHRHIRAISHFATCRAIIVRYLIKTSTKTFCDTIATSIARYEKYRCWASKPLHCPSFPCSFQKYPGNLKNIEDFLPCKPLKTLEKKEKTLRKTKAIPSKKDHKETKTSRKRTTG